MLALRLQPSTWIPGTGGSVVGNTIDHNSGGSVAFIEIEAGATDVLVANNAFSGGPKVARVLDNGTDTKYNQPDRSTLTTISEEGYSLFTIYGSSSVALASSTQLGTATSLA